MQRTVVKKNASIGAASVILGGVTIGENAMIGAGSVVTKDIPANELWVGNPAKFVRKTNNEDVCHQCTNNK
ncbi:MAG: DapH/DapD/GlmU-related protein [Paludibacteraceae bacterium]